MPGGAVYFTSLTPPLPRRGQTPTHPSAIGTFWNVIAVRWLAEHSAMLHVHYQRVQAARLHPLWARRKGIANQFVLTVAESFECFILENRHVIELFRIMGYLGKRFDI